MTGPQENKPEATQSEVDKDGKRVYSGAELRFARRKARKLGLDPKNGAEAISMLEERGVAIDNKEINIVQAATAQANGQNSQSSVLAPTTQKANLPMRRTEAQTPAVATKRERTAEIKKLQNKIVSRRNKKMFTMLRRFGMYVLLPTFAFAYFLNFVATPLYSANAILGIERASSVATPGGLSGLLGGGFADQPDSIRIQNYLAGREVYTLLQEKIPYVEQFMDPEVDRFRRIPEDASEEQKFKTYLRHVRPIYDSTDQVLRLEVRAFDPETALIVSNLLIGFAEVQLDATTQKIRDDGLATSREYLERAENELQEARQRIINLQSQENSFNPMADSASVAGLIQERRAILEVKLSQLAELNANAAPSQIRVRALEREIESISNRIEELNDQAINSDDGEVSLALLQQEMASSEADLASKRAAYEVQVTLYQTAESEAIKQGKYLTTSSPPFASFEPIYPKKLTTSIAAFFIFFGIYLFISMTVDVIREQVSA